MIKCTSIASVIFVNELTFRSQQIVGQNFKFFTVFIAAGIIYLIMTSAVSLHPGRARAPLQFGDRTPGAGKRFLRSLRRLPFHAAFLRRGAVPPAVDPAGRAGQENWKRQPVDLG